jgi:hypothetical protein
MTEQTQQPESEALKAEDVKSTLREGKVDITFIKKDGSLRRGMFTLDNELIPEDKRPKGGRAPSQAEVDGNIIRAFDVEIGEFRTITVPNIIAIFKREFGEPYEEYDIK